MWNWDIILFNDYFLKKGVVQQLPLLAEVYFISIFSILSENSNSDTSLIEDFKYSMSL